MVKRLAFRPWRLQIRGHENWASVNNGSAEPNSQCHRVPLSPWQKAAVAIGSLIGAANNPARADLVAAAGETTGGLAFQRMLQRMKNDEGGREILLHRPRVVSAAVEHAWDMKDNTFGAAYAKFMGSRNFNPDDRPPVRFVESDELAYVATRYREVHDFWHVLFDLPTNLLGEAALKMLEFQVTLMPMCFMAVLAGTARLKSQQQLMLYKHYLPWALSAGRSCSDLMCIYYERHLDLDLEEVRHKWGIITAPPLRQKT